MPLTGFKETGDDKKEGETTITAATDAVTAPGAAEGTTEVQPLKDITNKDKTDGNAKNSKFQPRPQREHRERGPPADGIPSKTKVMVANLPYDLTEDKVSNVWPEPMDARDRMLTVDPAH